MERAVLSSSTIAILTSAAHTLSTYGQKSAGAFLPFLTGRGSSWQTARSPIAQVLYATVYLQHAYTRTHTHTHVRTHTVTLAHLRTSANLGGAVFAWNASTCVVHGVLFSFNEASVAQGGAIAGLHAHTRTHTCWNVLECVHTNAYNPSYHICICMYT